jgi:hypothetical protein
MAAFYGHRVTAHSRLADSRLRGDEQETERHESNRPATMLGSKFSIEARFSVPRNRRLHEFPWKRPLKIDLARYQQ